MNEHLKDKYFLVGEDYTLADIVVFTNLLNICQYVLEPVILWEYRNVKRSFNIFFSDRQVLKVVQRFKFAERALGFYRKKYAEFQAEIHAAGKMDPFDSMPKGTFNYHDFKSCYSNQDKAVSIKYFWNKFDPEANSIWFGEYNYSEEFSNVFASCPCSFIAGMDQRLDKMRKQSFASVCLFGEGNNSSISGIWVWRGQDLAFTLSPDWQTDYEVYDWKKLDPKSEETKKLVNQYFSWTGTDSKGRKFNQGKIFK